MKRALILLLVLCSITLGAITGTYSPFFFDGDGSTVAFSVTTWGVAATSEVEVVVLDTLTSGETTLTETTDYAISATNNDYEDGFTVTTVETYVSTDTIVVRRATPQTQVETLITDTGVLRLETLVAAYDKLTKLVQDLQEEVDRSFKRAVTDAESLTSITSPESTSVYLQLDSSGDLQGVTSVSDSSITVTSWWDSTVGSDPDTWFKNFIADSNETEARATIDASRQHIYDVKEYGAVGDGATNDDVAIQLAIDAAEAASGGTVYFPSGTYLIDEQLDCTAGKMHFTGDGDTSILKLADSNDINILYIRGVAGTPIDYVEVSNLTFDGNRENQADTGTKIACFVRYAKHVNIHDCRFIHTGFEPTSSAARGKGVEFINVYNGKIQNNYFYDCHQSIAIAEATSISPAIVSGDLPVDLLISGNYIDANDTDPYDVNAYAIDAVSLQCYRSAFIGNTVKNVSDNFMGVYQSIVQDRLIGNQLITDNEFYNIGGICVQCDVSDANEAGWYFIIANNTMEKLGTGGIGTYGRSIITGNKIHNIGWSYKTGAPYGITISDSNTICTNNMIWDFNDTASETTVGITLWANSDNESLDNIVISDNVCFGSDFDIALTADSGYTITNCTITDNIVGKMFATNYVAATPIGVGKNIFSGNLVGTMSGGDDIGADAISDGAGLTVMQSDGAFSSRLGSSATGKGFLDLWDDSANDTSANAQVRLTAATENNWIYNTLYAYDVYPDANDTYWLGKPSAVDARAWKGLVLMDTTDGNEYKITCVNGALVVTGL